MLVAMLKALVLVSLAIAACKSGSDARTAEALTDLTASLDAVRAEFNAHASEPRFVTLLSAT
jgi:hypothetical protein